MVDSTANDVRMNKSKLELAKLVKDLALKNVPILLYYNKQDLNVDQKG